MTAVGVRAAADPARRSRRGGQLAESPHAAVLSASRPSGSSRQVGQRCHRLRSTGAGRRKGQRIERRRTRALPLQYWRTRRVRGGDARRSRSPPHAQAHRPRALAGWREAVILPLCSSLRLRDTRCAPEHRILKGGWLQGSRAPGTRLLAGWDSYRGATTRSFHAATVTHRRARMLSTCNDQRPGFRLRQKSGRSSQHDSASALFAAENPTRSVVGVITRGLLCISSWRTHGSGPRQLPGVSFWGS